MNVDFFSFLDTIAAEKRVQCSGSVKKSKSLSLFREREGGEREAPPPLTQLVLILLTEAVSGREEVPASLLVHLPHVRLLEEGEDGDMSVNPQKVSVDLLLSNK